jgi:hypothetical protein
MNDKLLWLVTTATLLSSIDATSARKAIRSTDDQLDRITAGSDFNQLPSVTSFLVNGSNGSGGANQFFPSIATLVPTVT